MEPVDTLRARVTVEECLAENPTNMPVDDRCDHFGSLKPFCWMGSKTYSGVPQMRALFKST